MQLASCNFMVEPNQRNASFPGYFSVSYGLVVSADFKPLGFETMMV